MLPFDFVESSISGRFIGYIIKIPRRCHWAKCVKGFQPFVENKNGFSLKGKYMRNPMHRIGSIKTMIT